MFVTLSIGYLCCEGSVLELWDSRPLCEFGLDAEPRLAVLPAAPSADNADPRRTELPTAAPSVLDPDAEPRLTDERRPPSSFAIVAFSTGALTFSMGKTTRERRGSHAISALSHCLLVGRATHLWYSQVYNMQSFWASWPLSAPAANCFRSNGDDMTKRWV